MRAHRDVLLVVDLPFDAGTLPAVRAKARDQARRVGFPDSRTADLVLAVHELAANAVSHGAGAGRLRIWELPGALHCQVDDGDPLASGDPAGPWPAAPGHGLWVVQQAADQMHLIADPHGTRATAIFGLPPSQD
jgi:anti-sigma regulatory factor (Ser/Thr protein kinase)